MKQWITLGLSAVVLLTSCDKQDALDTTSEPLVASATSGNGAGTSRATAATASANGVAASDWTQSSSWNSYDSSNYRIFYNDMTAPEVTNEVMNGGVVITFARVSVSAPEYQQFNQPTMLPFYFVGTNARPVRNAFYFYDHPTPGTTRISYSTQSMDGSMPAGTSLSQFQFRYFVFPASFLADHNLTSEMLHTNYTYNQILELADIKE